MSSNPTTPTPPSTSSENTLPATIPVAPESSSTTAIAQTTTPSRQLADVPRDELDALAEEFGLDPTRFKTRQHLVAAIHERRQLIAAMDRDAMMDVIRWGRRPVPPNAAKEQLALEIARVRSMRFAGLSQRGLVILARMRGLEVRGDEEVPYLVRRLKKQEGLFSKLNRKRRSFLGGLVSNMLGENEAGDEYQYLPPGSKAVVEDRPAPASTASNPGTIREEIEESGLIGGIANRVKKTADTYINQKLDEIESRIDRKLDEIDRRLAEWRDKEIANRIRILKITLWASAIVGAISLIYSYIRVYFPLH